MTNLTIEEIRNGRESTTLDFKQSLDLETDLGKSKLADDVVAFLNRGGGCLVVGVREKKGAFSEFVPVEVGNPDGFKLRLTTVVEDWITPKAIVSVSFVPHDAGTVVVVDIPDGRLKPYQNRNTGGFKIRGDGKNVSLTGDQMRAMFVGRDRYEQNVRDLMEREDRAVAERGILQQNASTLHVALVPFEHYDANAARFEPGIGVLKTMGHYHMSGGYHGDAFRGCDFGWEVKDARTDEHQATSRLFLGDDWLVHLAVAHPLSGKRNYGRLNVHEFDETFTRYMSDLLDFLGDEGVNGPYCLLARVDDLHANDGLKPFFPAVRRKSMSRPAFGERRAIEEAIKTFIRDVRSCSVYGAGY